MEYPELLKLAIEAGVKDNQYQTCRQGWVDSYSGVVEFDAPDGKRYRAVGRRPQGTPDTVYKNGYVDFFEI
jgi:hypothetical protein